MSKQYSIGIDIGGTNTKIGVVSRDGVVIKKDRFKTRADESFDDFLMTLIAVLNHLKADLDIIGVGVGAPNANGLTGMIVNPPNLSWGTVDLKKRLSDVLNLPVFVDNDANIAAVGEMIWGSAIGCKNFLSVTLGTGVGTGIVVDGKVLQSTKGGAGEGGHITVIADGRVCGCGCKGHLEAYVSASGILKSMRELTDLDVKLNELTNLLNGGNQQAIKVYDYSARLLGIGIASLASTLYPEKIILTGGVSAAGEKFVEMVKNYFTESCFPSFKNEISIELSTLSSRDGAILGASSLPFAAI